MSMTLFNSGGIDCKSFSKGNGKGLMDNQIRVGDYCIDTSDFAELVMYFFTNTDLEDLDIRYKLAHRIRELTGSVGFNPGNIRFIEE
jgi:hypothetical protein